MTSVLKNVKDALEFYSALGFESLPIRFVLNKEPRRKGKRTFQDSSFKQDLLQQLREEIGECMRCKLSQKRANIVFGEGDADAKLMFIGEGPGREEDIQGKPFVGDAGILLTRLIEKMGFKRGDVYIANIVKCRPPMNRDPEQDEIETCKQFIEKQIEIISPEVIISLGRVSSLTLLGNSTLKITAVRGNFFDYQGIPLMPTFHPAYLIRNPKEKWKTWNDAQKVLTRLKQLEKSSI
jgi:DNA polymerase